MRRPDESVAEARRGLREPESQLPPFRRRQTQAVSSRRIEGGHRCRRQREDRFLLPENRSDENQPPVRQYQPASVQTVRGRATGQQDLSRLHIGPNPVVAGYFLPNPGRVDIADYPA